MSNLENHPHPEDEFDRRGDRINELEAELSNIANADTSKWDDPSDFKAWAQSRARFVLASKR